jgi:hypothetical protein
LSDDMESSLNERAKPFSPDTPRDGAEVMKRE